MDNKFLNKIGLTRLIGLIKKNIIDAVVNGVSSMIYTNSNQTTATVGGITQGTDFANGVSIYSLLTAMLYPEEDPTAKKIAELEAKIAELDERVKELEKDLTFEVSVETDHETMAETETLSIVSDAGAYVQEERAVLDSKLLTVEEETLVIHKLGE